MLKVLELDHTKNNVMATRASEKLTKTDYEKLLPILKDKIKQSGKVRWYFEMEDFQGWELKAFWEDVKFDVKHANDFEKIAMVGDKKWQEWMTDLMKPFTSAEIKYFDLDQRDDALMWIRS